LQETRAIRENAGTLPSQIVQGAQIENVGKVRSRLDLRPGFS
jgi:hypothetical protein